MTITPGTPFTINALGDEPIGIGLMDASNAIAVYRESGVYRANVVQNDETVGAKYSFAGFANSEDDTIAVDGLSSTTAISLRSKQGAGCVAQILSRSGTTLTTPGAEENLGATDPFGLAIVALSSTSAIAVWADDDLSERGTANYLTVSGSTITNESSVVFEASAGLGLGTDVALCKLSATKAVVVYEDEDDSSQLKAVVLSVTGVTISAGSSATIDAGDAGDFPALAAISSTSCLLAYRNVTDTDIKAVVLSGMSGTTVTVNTPIIIEANDGLHVGLAAFSATQFVATYSDSGSTDGRMIELAVSGVTVSTVGTDVQFDPASAFGNNCVAFSSTLALNVFAGTSEGVLITLSADALGLAAMTKPADIDAAGGFIYVALLEGATPILTKISTALNADGTTVFDPGAGDNIGVECGRFNSDVVWVAGNFDGTNVIEKSEDGGTTFTVKDDATIGNVRTFVMGPDSDEKLLIFDETNGDILETKDDGASWDSINASVTPEINAIGRLGRNTQEAVFGNQGAANNSINYSVNSGNDLEDYQTGVYPSANATRVIVN